jgi:hypothetical protein
MRTRQSLLTTGKNLAILSCCARTKGMTLSTNEAPTGGNRAAFRGDESMVIRAICAGFVIGALACAFQPAQARNTQPAALKPAPKNVTRVRIGVLPTRSPRLGPQISYRGGYTPLDDMVRPRFIGGMIDLYPTERSGIRLSIGTRYFARPNFWIAAEQATGGILYDPHMTRGGRSLSRGFRRSTPAMTLGYDREVSKGFVLGLEGGALSDRAIMPTRPSRWSAAGVRDGGFGLNPVATMSARFAF